MSLSVIRPRYLERLVFICGLAFASSAVCAQEPPQGAGSNLPKIQPAETLQAPIKQMVLGTTRAGRRLIAVGDHGVVLLSDDEGKNFRQAKSVPISSTLTGVSFADEMNGWAVGHWGAIIATEDGGETWKLQRNDTTTDRPLFSVYFSDVQHGLAVGLWSLMLITQDGGRTWTEMKLPPPPEGGKADRNLLQLFSDGKGNVFVAAERGAVLRSQDKGQTWTYLDTGYKGSFWTGCALGNGLVLVAGLRGTIYRSMDNGATWALVQSKTKSSITNIVLINNKIYAVGLDGVLLVSSDSGASFVTTQREDRAPLTTVSAIDEHLMIFSKFGLIESQ